MDMPRVADEMKRLSELFTGTWCGEEKLYPSPWDPIGGPAFGTWVVKPGAAGFCLLVDYTEERNGVAMYHGHGVHGFDHAERAFFAYWFDNIGFMPKSAVRVRFEGDRYTYQEASPMGHSRFTYAWHGDVFEFSIERSPDGTSWSPMHEGRYQRV